MIEKILLTIQNHPRALILSGVALALVVAGLLYLQTTLPKSGPAPTTFGECAALYKVHEGFPRTCSVPWWGKTFVEYVGNQNKFDTEVHLSLPPALVIAASPLIFSGEARPEWLAGSGLAVSLVSGTGEVVGTAVATQDAHKAGAGFAPFAVSIPFTPQAPGTQGALVFKNSASSTQILVVPVVF